MKTGFAEIDPLLHRFRLSAEPSKEYVRGNLEATQLFVDFSESFASIRRGKMEQILQEYGLPKVTVIAIMTLNKNSREIVRSPDGGNEFFDILTRILQRYISSIFVHKVDRSNKKWVYT